jgi:hypothetical protein
MGVYAETGEKGIGVAEAIDRDLLLALKINIFTKGLRITAAAEERLTLGGRIPLTVHEYATTGGVTLVIGDMYVNGPFDNSFCTDPEVVVTAAEDGGAPLSVVFRGHRLPARPLLLPAYLNDKDPQGRALTDTVFSHADRIRVSPIHGCSFACKFCDIAGSKYYTRSAEQLIAAINLAKGDAHLPAQHMLVSGGTPSRKDYEYFDETCAALVKAVDMPVDVMMPPRMDDPGFIDRLADVGVNGFSINLEVFQDEVAAFIDPQKNRLHKKRFAAAIERAVARTGGGGKVRSLILVGLEPEEKTLEGVEFLASLGCDPVLSPFRPTPGTGLADWPPPSEESLHRVYEAAVEITDRYGVKLGPRCIPCQHNTLTVPDGSGAYHFT